MIGITSFFRVLINTNIFVSICVFFLALSSEILLKSTNNNISFFIFFASLFTYNIQRIIRIKKGTNHKRKEWTLKHLKLIYLLIIIGASFSMYYFLKFNTQTQNVIFLTGIVSIMYPFGIRSIPYCKILIISSVWTIASMYLLISENNLLLNNNVILHLISRFLFVFAITIPFDIRDVKYDKNNLKTIPISLGIQKSKLLSIFALLLICFISIVHLSQKIVNLSVFFTILIICVFSCILIFKSDEKKEDFFFSFWIESLSVFFYLFLVISLLI